jgi:hypothetical protein
MRGAIRLLPNTPSWRGVKLKRRDKFTFISELVKFTLIQPFLPTQATRYKLSGKVEMASDRCGRDEEDNRNASSQEKNPSRLARSFQNSLALRLMEG